MGGVRGVWVRWGDVAPMALRWCNPKEAMALAVSTDIPDTSTDNSTAPAATNGATS